jgi:steroid delta-isomerase-like uncharacterized protein
MAKQNRFGRTWRHVTAGLSVVVATGIALGLHATTRSKGDHTMGERINVNKAIARRWSEDLWGQGQLAVADEIIASDYERHDPGDPFPARGPDDVKRIVTMLRTMLPDLRIDVEMQIAEGDLVVNRYTSRATDTVGYLGMPPTGRSIRTTAIQIFRIVDGKIVESWAVRDDAGTLRQLGRLPLPLSGSLSTEPGVGRATKGDQRP